MRPTSAMPPELAPALNLGALHLRPVEAADYAFLRALYRDVRSQELSATGWPPEAISAFCDSQFDLQDRHYRAHYPHAHFYVVEKAGVSVGRIYVSDGPQTLGLMEVSLLSALRGQGLGTALLQWLVSVADASGKSMELHVEPHNPARLWYERWGFAALPELSGTAANLYLKMLRPATTTGLA